MYTYTNIVSVTAALAATASAFDCNGPYFSFYNRHGSAMSYQRLDAALSPNAQSSHLHSFDGGNGLTVDMDYAATQSSTCTTARIKPDKSLYWRPTLYWNGNDTGFYRVPEQYSKVYYKFGDAGNVKANVSEFPEGFKMVAGDAMLRSKGDNAAGIQWSCIRENDRIDDVGFPTGFTDCTNGYATQITFPACWNGQDSDPKNPLAHMAYPTASGLGLDACPDTHKVARFPSIFIEFWYDISSFVGHFSSTDQPFVLANGDPTGYGFHADFMNGWEKGVLAKATAPTGYCDCGCGCGNDEMKQCFGDDQVNDDEDADFKSCAAVPSFPGEDTTPVDKLPGCNPLQSGPAEATMASGAGCTAAASGSVALNTTMPTYTAKATTAQAYSTASAPVSSAEVDGVSSQPLQASLSSSLASNGDGFTMDYGSATDAAVHQSTSASPGSSYAATPVAGTASYSAPTGSLASEEALNGPSYTLASYTLAGSAIASASTFASVTVPSSEACGPQTTITITPTITVTAGAQADATTCTDSSTAWQTVKEVYTVTVPAGGYKHKRHLDLHKYM